MSRSLMYVLAGIVGGGVLAFLLPLTAPQRLVVAIAILGVALAFMTRRRRSPSFGQRRRDIDRWLWIAPLAAAALFVTWGVIVDEGWLIVAGVGAAAVSAFMYAVSTSFSSANPDRPDAP